MSFHIWTPHVFRLNPQPQWLPSESGSQKFPEQLIMNVEYKIDYISKIKNRTKKLMSTKIRFNTLRIFHKSLTISEGGGGLWRG